MLISIRGNNGSGKSYIIQNLFGAVKATRPIYGILGPKNPEAYELHFPKVDKPTFILGPYQTRSGGADCVQPYELIVPMIEKFARRGHVIFEGSLITTVYGQIGECMSRWKANAVWLFLDTSLEVCMDRVEARRGGRERDERLIKNMKSKHHRSSQVRKMVVKEGSMRIMDINSTTGHEVILKLLREAKWSNVLDTAVPSLSGPLRER